MNNNDTKKTTLQIMVVLVLLIIILAGGFIAKQAITGGATVINLASASPVVGQATQPLIGKSDSKATLDTSGYTLQNVVFFDNNTWLVGTLNGHNGSDNSTVIMQKMGAFYQVVLGPGSNFPSNASKGLPPDVAKYLTEKGMVYTEDED